MLEKGNSRVPRITDFKLIEKIIEDNCDDDISKECYKYYLKMKKSIEEASKK
jgi:hypothetical protein